MLKSVWCPNGLIDYGVDDDDPCHVARLSSNDPAHTILSCGNPAMLVGSVVEEDRPHTHVAETESLN